MKRRAFTLIELLVVIAILGLLAAILFPVFAHVRENGRRTACLSNERQLGMAIMQYAADNDSLFPNDQSEDTAGQWAAQVYPFIRTAQVYRCSDDPTADEVLKVYRKVGTARQTFYYSVDSYGINWGLVENATLELADINNGVKNKVLKPTASEASLTAPAKTALLFEVQGCTTDLTLADALLAPEQALYGCAASGNVTAKASDSDEGYANGCQTKGLGIFFGVHYATGQVGGRTDPFFHSNFSVGANEPRHNGGSNYLACDGHAVWLRPVNVSGGQSQPMSGTACGQDDPGQPCGGKDTAAGTANSKYALTFSIH